MNKGKAEKTEDKENAKQKDKLIDNLNQFKETRWFPLVVALVIIGAGIIVAFLLGLRITYAPELENSWDAISAVASWASVAASFFAVWAAIQIPKKIAKKQDAIALFDKRYELYSELYKWYYLAEEIIEYANNIDEARGVFDVLYNDISGDVNEILAYVEAMYNQINGEINKVRFLFPLEEDDCKEISSFISIARKVLIEDEFDNNLGDLKKKFESEEFKRIFDIIRYELSVAKMR